MQNRYFFISIRAIVNTYERYANLTVHTDDGTFPSKFLVEKAYELECEKQESKVNSFIILNVFEFTSEADYKSWTKTEEQAKTN